MNKDEFLSFYYRNLLLGIDTVRIDGAIFKVLSNDIVVMISYDSALDYDEIKIFDFVDVIGEDCFASNKSIKKIDLSNVYKIEHNAFEFTNLDEVLHNGKLRIIEKNAFRFSSISKIDLSCVDVISTGAFLDCRNLEFVSLKDRVRLAGRVFKNTGLININLNADIVQNGTFSLCHNLESISINSYLIMANAFDDCNSLSHVSINRECKVEDATILNYLNR